MARGYMLASWDHTAILITSIANMLSDKKSKKMDYREMHPIRSQEISNHRGAGRGHRLDAATIDAVRAAIRAREES